MSVLDVFMSIPEARPLNPAQIERAARGGVTRAGAPKACARLVELGILTKEEGRSPKHRKDTVRFRLERTPARFVALVKSHLPALRRRDQDGWLLDAIDGAYQTPFFKGLLEADTIRWILWSRGAEIFYDTYIGPKEKPGTLNESTGQYMVDEELLAHRKRIRFLVSSSEATKEQLLDHATKSVRDLQAVEKLPLRKIVDLHYGKNYEYRAMVVPLLALCQASPSALLTFCSDWTPDPSREPSEVASVEHLLFRMIMDAVSDVSRWRRIPYGYDVSLAEFRPTNPRRTFGTSPLLQLVWQERNLVGYEASFSSRFPADPREFGTRKVNLNDYDFSASAWTGGMSPGSEPISSMFDPYARRFRTVVSENE